MKIAFFDLDHTLLPLDTGDEWTHLLAKQLGPEAPKALEEADAINEGYKRGQFDIDACMAFQLGLLARFPRVKLEAMREAFVDEMVRPRVKAAALALVESARQSGFHPVLATGTHRFIAEAIAPLFGIHDVIAAEPEQTPEGEFTGRLVGSHSYQEGKLRLVKEYIARQEAKGEVISAIQAYSDSINDQSLLKFAQSRGKAFAVNPDAQLTRLAMEYHWPIVELFGKEEH